MLAHVGPIKVGGFSLVDDFSLRFDRAKARGQRLDIPSGTAVRFEPGQRREVTLVPFGGRPAVAATPHYDTTSQPP